MVIFKEDYHQSDTIMYSFMPNLYNINKDVMILKVHLVKIL